MAVNRRGMQGPRPSSSCFCSCFYLELPFPSVPAGIGQPGRGCGLKPEHLSPPVCISQSERLGPRLAWRSNLRDMREKYTINLIASLLACWRAKITAVMVSQILISNSTCTSPGGALFFPRVVGISLTGVPSKYSIGWEHRGSGYEAAFNANLHTHRNGSLVSKVAGKVQGHKRLSANSSVNG